MCWTFWWIGKKHHLPVFGTVLHVHPAFNNTVQVRAVPLSKQCGPHELHTHTHTHPHHTHTHIPTTTHTPVSSCKLVSRTVDEENFFHQRNREDQRTISGSIKAAGWGGCLPMSFAFPPNHVLSCWLGAPQTHTGSGEEHRRRTKLESHRYWHTNRVQERHDKMSGMIWCQLDGHLFRDFCGTDVAAGQVEGKSKGRNWEGLEQSHTVAVWQWAEASSPWSEKQDEDDTQKDLGALCGVASCDPTLVLNALGRLELEIQTGFWMH